MSTPNEPVQIDPTGFYFTQDDGYLALSHYTDPEDETTGQLVCFVSAGDSLAEVLAEAQGLDRQQQT